MKAKTMTLIKRRMGLARMLLPPRTLRTIGIAVSINSTGKSHIITNSGIGNPSLKLRRLLTSMIMNGRMSRKLMIAGSLELVRIFCMISA